MLGFWSRVARHVEAGRPFALCTVVGSRGSVPRRAGARMLVFPDGSIDGSVGGAGAEERVREAAVEALRSGSGPQLLTLELWHRSRGGLDSLCGGSITVHIEPIPRETHVLIFGAGHVGEALARILAVNEYQHSVVDDRKELLSRERFADARDIHVEEPRAFAARQDLDLYTHAVLLGYSHASDLEVLVELLPRFPGYVGLIGSRAKAREMRSRLRERGVAAAHVERLRCPLGVDIATETAAEIATSIAAEIVHEVRRASRADRCTGDRPGADAAAE